MGFGFSGGGGGSTGPDGSSIQGLIDIDTTYFITTTGDDTNDGSSDSPWLTLAKPFDFLKDKTIASDVTVTIDIADGTYDSQSSISLNHPNGDRINIVGNVATEANVILDFTLTGAGSDGLTVTDGNTIGNINGLTIQGTWIASPDGVDKSGLIVSKNATVNLGANVTINKFYYGIRSEFSGYVFADSCLVKNAGRAGFWAIHGGIIEANTATVNVASGSVSLDPGGSAGFLAERGGIIRGESFTGLSCAFAAISAVDGGLIVGRLLNADNGARHGIYSNCARIISEKNISVTGNAERGIHLENGSIFLGADGTISTNSKEGIHLEQSVASFSGDININSNTEDNILVSRGSSFRMGTSATANNSTSGSGIRVTEGSRADIPSTTLNNNGQWGIECDLSSFIEGTSTTKTGNTSGATSITINTLSSDGSYIKA